jgi:hypothetical protein
MHTIVSAIAFLLCMVPALAHTMPLEPYLWNRRLLIIFAPSLDDPGLLGQRERNAHAIEGLQARDMVVFAVIGDDHVNAELNDAPAGGAAEIRRRFEVHEDGFAVVLVGKDGTEKFRSAEPIEPEIIFDIVDGMPMRRREMRERKT